eukprot:gene793-562_t
MATITLTIRGKSIVHSPSEDSVRKLKEELPEVIASQFADSPLRSSIVALFGTEGNPLSDENRIMQEAVIFVFEIFTTTPCPLYRTVQPHQIHPAVETSHDDNPWSRMSPLYCGSFHKKSEITDASPFYVEDATPSTSMAVRGMSLKSVVPTRTRDLLTDPVLEEEEQGWSLLSDLASLGMDHSEPTFGLLHTSTLIGKAPFHNVLHINVDEAEKPSTIQRRNDAPNRRRMIFFTYELPANTNLQDLGMAVVFDDADPASPGHFTLIPWHDPMMRDPSKNQMRELAEQEHQLNNHVLTVAVSDDGDSRTYCDVNIGGHSHVYRTFPLVAAQFQFHSMWMNATAAIMMMQEDLDDEDHDSSAKQKVARGASVFYRHLEELHQPEEDALPLLSLLMAADYDIRRMSTCEVHRLHRVFEFVLSVRSLEAHEYDDVYEALAVVESLLA